MIYYIFYMKYTRKLNVKPKRVLVLLDQQSNSGTFTYGVIPGIAEYIRQKSGMELAICVLHNKKLPLSPSSFGAAGIIFRVRSISLSDCICNQTTLPVVGLFCGPRNRNIPHVDIDNKGTCELAANYFLERGYLHFGYVPSGKVPEDVREKSFRNTLAKAGRHLHILKKGLRLKTLPWQTVSANAIAWLKSLPNPAAILAANDENAHVIVNACFEAGLSVPEDIAVLGIHDNPIFCRATRVELSSIPYPNFDAGYKAAEMLDEMIRGKTPEVPHLLLPPKGVISRNSTAAFGVKDSLVSQAVQHIQHFPLKNLTPEEIARDLGVSRNTLDQHFRTVLKRSVYGEITRVRIEKAKKHLCENRLSIPEIADLCGFSTRDYFSSFFHRHVSTWPGEFRRLHISNFSF